MELKHFIAITIMILAISYAFYKVRIYARKNHQLELEYKNAARIYLQKSKAGTISAGIIVNKVNDNINFYSFNGGIYLKEGRHKLNISYYEGGFGTLKRSDLKNLHKIDVFIEVKANTDYKYYFIRQTKEFKLEELD